MRQRNALRERGLGGIATVNCRLITVSEKYPTYWDALLSVQPSRVSLARDDVDSALLDSKDTKDLVSEMMKRAVALKVDNVRLAPTTLSFRIEFDSIGTGTFRGKIYPIPEHHEVLVRVPTGSVRRIAFVFGKSYSANMVKGRLNRVLARRGAFVDLPISAVALGRILANDATEILASALKGVRTRFRSTFEGSRVDTGMADYIGRARGEGGTDDMVEFVSRALECKVSISVTHSAISAAVPPGDEGELIDYVLQHILPALR